MCYVNAFASVSNDHREVSIGGRRCNNSVRAWLNTAHAGGEAAIDVSAMVYGTGLTSKERRRKDGDRRAVRFYVKLPAVNEHVSVRVEADGLPEFDSVLVVGQVSLRAAVADLLGLGDSEAGQVKLKGLSEAVKSLADGVRYPLDMQLPGGVSLKYALACVEVVRLLRGDEP